MKKLLVLLGAVSITASSAATVVACGDNTQQKEENNKEIKESQNVKDIRDKSLDAVKGSILADQYGLNYQKTKDTTNWLIRHQDYQNKTDNFNNETVESSLNGLDKNGTRGEDNKPLKDLLRKINGGKIGDVDLLDYVDEFWNVIKDIPGMGSELPIETLLQLIPTVFKVAANFFHVNLGPKTIEKIISIINEPIRQVVQIIDIRDSFEQFREKSLTETMNIGIDSLNDTFELLFQNYKKDKDEPAIAQFLGNEVLTKVLNKQEIDKDKIIKDLEITGGLNSIDIIEGVKTFVASFILLFGQFHQYANKDAKDPQHLFEDGKTTTDSMKEILAKTVDINKNTMSLNNFVTDLGFYLTSRDAKKLGIFKLLNIVFTNDSIEKLIKPLLKTLDYTDYQLDIHDPLPIPSGIPVEGNFTINININQLSKTKEIHILYVKAIKIIEGDIKITAKNNLVDDFYELIFKKMIPMLISNIKLDKNGFKKFMTTLFGSKQNISLWLNGDDFVDKMFKGFLGGIPGIAWNTMKGKVLPITEKISIYNAFYDEKKIVDLIKTLGVMDDTKIAEFKKENGIDEFTVSAILQAKIGKYFDMIKPYDLDAVYMLISTLLYKNPIQIEDSKLPNNLSLLSQIIASLDDLSKMNTLLGYTTGDNPKHSYVMKDSFMGYLVRIIYPEFKENNEEKIDLNVLDQFTGNKEAIENIIQSFANSLKGEDLTDLIKSNFENKESWKITDVQNGYFEDGKTLMYEMYTVEFKGTDNKKGKYEVSYQRLSETAKFSFKSIKKLN